MAKRRGNKEGSIHQRDNGTWRAQVTINGRRLSFSSKTRHEVQVWLKKTNRQIDEGMTFESTRMIFGEYISHWLSCKKASIRKTTWIHYNQLTQRFINPLIGHIKILDLKTYQIQELYNQLLEQEVGIPTVEKIHTIIHSVLSHANKTGLINRNPASNTIPPKAPTKEKDIYDESQISQMLIAANGHRWETLYHLAVTTGMRQSELLGLKWIDLDWNKKTIKVERQLVRPDGSGIKFVPPKTKYGKRNLAIGSKTIDTLRSHYENQHIERKNSGEKWKDYGLIFTNKNGGPIHPRNLLRDFKKLSCDAGLPEISFHDLRHTCASLLLNHGVPVIVVSRRLGHARPSITLDTYGHLLPSIQVEAAEKLDELVTPLELHPIAPELHQEHTYTHSATINTPTGGHL